MGVISVISGFAAIILLYSFIIITYLKGFKKGRKFLFIALIPFIICLVCKTENVREWLFWSFVAALLFPAYNLSEKEYRKDILYALVNLIVVVLCMIVVATTGNGKNKSHNSKYGDVWNKNPNEWTQDEKDYIDENYDWLNDN